MRSGSQWALCTPVCLAASILPLSSAVVLWRSTLVAIVCNREAEGKKEE